MQTKCCQKRIKFSFPTDGGCFAAVAVSETSSHLICSLSDLHLNKQKETQKATKQNTVTTVTIKTNTRAHKQNILTAKKQEQTKNLFLTSVQENVHWICIWFSILQILNFNLFEANKHSFPSWPNWTTWFPGYLISCSLTSNLDWGRR